MKNHLDSFTKTWNELCNKYENFDKRDLLDQLIKAWLQEFKYQDQKKKKIYNYAKSFYKNSKIETDALEFYKCLLLITDNKFFGKNPIKFVNRIDPIGMVPNVKTKIEELDQKTFKEIISKSIMDGNQVKFLLLIAFVLAAIGIAIYQLNQNESSETENPPPPNGSSKTVLFFALYADDAEEYQVIDDLESNSISPNVVNFMSRTSNIKTLWQGTEKKYESTKIKECENYPSAPQKDQDDIYLVKMILDKREPEFEEDSPATSWRRAFRRIADNKNFETIKVLGRKPKEAVNNPNLKTPR